MRRVGRIAAVAGGVIAVGLIALVFRTLNTAGEFTQVIPGYSGVCHVIRGVTGAEDIVIDRAAGLAFISATDRRPLRPGRPAFKDGIYLFWLAHPGLGVTRLSGTPRDFHPHGIDLYRAPDGSLTLMAVNHRASGEASIDSFAVSEEMDAHGVPAVALSERDSVRSSLIFGPNDVAAVGRDRFYVTNDHGSKTGFGRFLETWLMLPRANVVYYDGNVPRVVATGLRFANGIAVSHDGMKLYVAETLGRDILTYRRQPGSGGLSFESTFPLTAAPDNIDVDGAGDLWVAGHPKLFALLRYGEDPTKPSPSEVFEVKTADGIPRSLRSVFTDMGHEIGASSVGASVDGQLLIGSVFDPKFLDCARR